MDVASGSLAKEGSQVGTSRLNKYLQPVKGGVSVIFLGRSRKSDAWVKKEKDAGRICTEEQWWGLGRWCPLPGSPRGKILSGPRPESVYESKRWGGQCFLKRDETATWRRVVERGCAVTFTEVLERISRELVWLRLSHWFSRDAFLWVWHLTGPVMTYLYN